MELNLERLSERLSIAQSEDTVSKEGVNPYLIEAIIEPMLAGKSVKYGDIDFAAFELDELRTAAGYCDNISNTSYKLEKLVANISVSKATACKMRAFC